MGRLTQMIDFMNKKVAPTKRDCLFHYTHINRDEAMKLRKVYLKRIKSICPESKTY